MNFNVIASIKKLVGFYKNFSVDVIPEILETVAKLFRESKEIIDAFTKQPFGVSEGSYLTPENLIAEIEAIYADSGDDVTHKFNPAWIPLVVELVTRLLARRS